ncbi:MAG: diguanylate cyclase [Clostridia bacterium]|nr:diguanylate cyclase [Clostridia bacterium]
MIHNSPIHFIREFIGQKVPKDQKEKMPLYYQRALNSNNSQLGFLILIITVLSMCIYHRILWFPLVLFVCVTAETLGAKQMSMNQNLLIHAVTTILWCSWYLYTFGWSSGGQHFLLPLLMLIFFSVYVKPAVKIVYFVALVAVRMLFFYYTRTHEPMIHLDTGMSILYQTINSLLLFITMATNCIIFSTSIQETERQLLLDNQELQHEAETDALTQMLNRRSIRDEMVLFQKANPDEQFCVAIADIDFFKRVNDTYGHACGDETLRMLAKCFRDHSDNKYSCGRWGGEEFCLFFPQMNLDVAGNIMQDLALKIQNLPIEFEGQTIHITITAGVEEYDFKSDLDAIIERADRKLYMGKTSGRNRVII